MLRLPAWATVVAMWPTVITARRAVVDGGLLDVNRLLHIHRRRLVVDRWWWLLHVDRLRLNINRLLLHIHRPILIDQCRADDGRADDRAKHCRALPAMATTRFSLAVKAFTHTARYDSAISNHLTARAADFAVTARWYLSSSVKLVKPCPTFSVECTAEPITMSMTVAMGRGAQAGVLFRSAEALEHLAQDAYDCAVLDLRLPGSSGPLLRITHAAQVMGSTLRVKVQARDVSLALAADSASSILNRLPVRVRESRPAANPAHVLVSLDAGGNALLARITRFSADQLGLHTGQVLFAQIKSVALLG